MDLNCFHCRIEYILRAVGSTSSILTIKVKGSAKQLRGMNKIKANFPFFSPETHPHTVQQNGSPLHFCTLHILFVQVLFNPNKDACRSKVTQEKGRFVI